MTAQGVAPDAGMSVRKIFRQSFHTMSHVGGPQWDSTSTTTRKAKPLWHSGKRIRQLGSSTDVQPSDVGFDQHFPFRQIRAAFAANSLTVYQAFSPEIAEAALAAGRFVPPFKLDRMTWIKPSFLWTMYRCGWATKPGQERVLAVTIERDGFEWALAHSSLSHYDPAVYSSHAQWVERKKTTPVRIQWDPERSLLFEPLGHRTIQIGLSAEAARRYASDWTIAISDITALAHEIHRLVAACDLTAATDKLPAERPYPLADRLKAVIGAT